MLNWLKFDLLEIPSDIWEMVRGAFILHTDPKEAPPSTRKILVGVASLLNDAGNPIGCFSPDLYEMAKMGYLRCQREQNDSEEVKRGRKPPYISLTRTDGTLKTPFELSVLPVAWRDNNPDSVKTIRKIIEDEYYSLKNAGISLPPLEYKYQIASDYLRFLPEKTGMTVGSVRDLELTIQNPADQTPTHERVFHYIAQRSALILTIVAALLIIPGTTSYLPLALVGAVLANWCMKEFFTYDLVETLMRDFKGMRYSKGEPISLKKALKTSILMLALLGTTVAVGYGAWAELLALPFFTAKTAALAKVMTGAHYALAGFATFFAAAGTFVGGTVCQRFFWGLGVKYKQINFEHDININRPLPDLSNRQALDSLQMRHKVKQWQDKTLHRNADLSAEQIEHIKQAFSDLAAAMSLNLDEVEVTAGEPVSVEAAVLAPAAPALVVAAAPSPAAAAPASSQAQAASDANATNDDVAARPALQAAL